jgi:hypothetical protein
MCVRVCVRACVRAVLDYCVTVQYKSSENCSILVLIAVPPVYYGTLVTIVATQSPEDS